MSLFIQAARDLISRLVTLCRKKDATPFPVYFILINAPFRMCGINGFNFRDEKLVLKMNQLTSHRGPDQTDFFVSDDISLGHNRLSIIDLSEKGRQPMWNEGNDSVIIFNGEIYNFQELKKDLERKYTFKSKTDTEVILYAYKEYGADCLNKFNGIFALAIWNVKTKELFLARDRMGIKPLYYFFDGKQLVFSSEIKAILAHNVPREVDREAFNLYFQLLYVPEPHTMFKGIEKLPPASFLIFKNNVVEVQKYWKVEDFADVTDKTRARLDIKSLFDDAVRMQLISDRPVGIFLSGGFDSTAILGAASKYVSNKIKTFSIGYEDSAHPEKFNADFFLARQTAKFYNTKHYELMISPKDIIDNMEKLVWHMDEPNHNATASSNFLLSKLAKQEVSVVLGGDGGDELFGGYQRYYYSYLISLFQKIPLPFRKLGEVTLKIMRKQKALNKINTPQSAERILAFLSQKDSLLSRVIKKEVYQSNVSGHYLTDHYLQNIIKDFEKQFMDIDRKSWLVDECLMRIDKMSMAFGLETRIPVLDYRLVEMANRIPTPWKVNARKNLFNDFQGKQIWKESLGEYFPAYLSHQPKRGWFSPTAKWLRSGLKDFASQVLSEVEDEYFDRKVLRELWRRHLNVEEYNLDIIWSVVMWQMWYNCFIKKR